MVLHTFTPSMIGLAKKNESTGSIRQALNEDQGRKNDVSKKDKNLETLKRMRIAKELTLLRIFSSSRKS